MSPIAKPLLIGLSGKAGSGKTTLANYLVKQHGYKDFAFADKLKVVVGAAFDLSYDQLHGHSKEIVDPRWGRSPRWLMQFLGTDILRSHWPDIWIRHLRQTILDVLSLFGQKPIVITDVRFIDEAEALRQLGAVLVRLERPGAGARAGIPDHISESELDAWKIWDWDFVINNSGTLEDLSVMAEILVNGKCNRGSR